MEYTEVVFSWDKDYGLNAEVLMAQLADAGFEGFMEEESCVTAYIANALFNEDLISNCDCIRYAGENVRYKVKALPDTNWNSVWESNFPPVYIQNCIVRAPFHEKPEDVLYDIVIEPKMSFGTGHHETTSQVVAMMLACNFKGKSVLDMGCGTGVLAILAALMDAGQVDAVDNDIWSYENTIENIARNNTPEIQVYHGSMDTVQGRSYDVVIANITRNILLEFMPGFALMQKSGGQLFLSGFFVEDRAVIEKSAEALGYVLKNASAQNNWAALELFMK